MEIRFNSDTCKKCSLCAEVCPNKIIVRDKSNVMTVRQDRLNLCFQCGQCMAVCPTQAIITGELSYTKDFFALPESSSYENAFFDMIRTRRAIRNFKPQAVPKELLQKVVDAISFAPPGFPPVKTELIVVQDPDIIKKALPYMIELYDYLVNVMDNPVKRFFVKKAAGPQMFKKMQNHLIPLLKSRLPELKNGTEDTITRYAPAMILFHTDPAEEDIKTDVTIAATYGMLAAHALGLGGAIMDIIPPAINKKEELRKMFSLPDNHEVLGSIILGYPKYKYQRGIKRELKSVKWL